MRDRRDRRRRHRPGRRDARRDLLGVALMALGALALFALAGAATVFRPPALDPETLCAEGRAPSAHTLILVDATDRLEPRHRAWLRAVAAQEQAALAPHDRLSVMLLDPRSPREPRLLFSLCHPGDGRSVNPLIANTRAAQDRWRDGFAAPLEAALAQAEGAGAANASPIAEALAAAASSPGFALGAPTRRLVLVSDLLEHHPGGFSHFRDAAGGLAAFRATREGARVRLDLAGVALRVAVLDRPDHAARQAQARADFWAPLFTEANAAAVRWDGAL